MELEGITLFDLYKHRKISTFNVVFYNFKTKQTLSFNELHAHINDIAEYLKSEIPAHSVIGCLIRPCLALPAIILGMSKISSPFMFLNLNDPIFSLQNLQKFVPVNALLVEETLLEDFEEQLCTCWKRSNTVILSNLSPLILLKSFDCKLETCSTSKSYPNYLRNAAKIAYIIQTSGTTGPPKIVQVPHRCIIPNIIDIGKIYDVNSKDVLLMCSPLTFDPSIVEIFIAVMSGCTLVIVPDQMRCIPKRICNVIVDSKVTVIQPTPSLIKSFDDQFIKDVLFSKDSALRVMAFAGEVCPSVNKLKRWIAEGNQTRLYNLYGLTEVSCLATCYKIDLNNIFSADIPLGNPLLETDVELNDEGEIFIGGEKRWCIVDDEMWPDIKGPFMRKTGDYALKTDDGLYFIGRKDSIVNHNGQKLSLTRIGNVLDNIEEILNHYIHFDHELSRMYLFVVQDVKKKSLRERKQEIVETIKEFFPNLPATEVQIVPYIPLTKHGKCDHLKLFEFAKSKWHQTKAFAFNNYNEIISNLWKSYTNQPTISENDNFIMCGGDSFLAVQLASNIEWELHISAPELIEKLFNHSFKDVVKVAKKHLAGTRRSNHNSNSFIFDDLPVEVVLKKAPSDSECYEMATRRGYSLMCKHSDNNTCRSSDLELQEDVHISLKLRCKFYLKKSVDASPCVAYFFESKKLLAFVGSHSGQFSCINVIDNNFEWTSNIPDRIESSPCLSSCGKYVLVGCHDQHLYGIEIETGNIKWSLTTDGEIKSSPVVSPKNIAYVGSRDKHLYAVKADSGELVWKQLISKGSIFSSPALSKDMMTVAVATLDGVLALLKMDTGTIIWTYNYGKPLFSSPVLTSTSIFVGSTDNCMLQFDLSGKLVSEHSTYGPVFSSPVLDESLGYEQVIFGCHDCNVYCVSHQSEYLWRFCCDSPVYATPFIFQWMQNKYVVVACTAGDIYILNQIDGEVMYFCKCPGEIFSSPVVLNNILVIGCRDNNVYTFNLCDIM